jgi:phosphoglucosamine mutase
MMKVGRAVAYYFQEDNSKAAEQTSAAEEKSSCEPEYSWKNDLGGYFSPYTKHINDPHKLTVVIGKDTRQSGYMIENAIASGLTAQGANVIMLGPLPTPAISMLVRSLRADVGVMISASHNPFHDNGIKFFDAKGLKFDSELEETIEKIVFGELPLPDECGGAIRLNDAAGRYVEFAKSTLPKGLSLAGIKTVLDCANGAAYKVAPRVFWELGASVVVLANNPNGSNINRKCGALHPDLLIDHMRKSDAHIGFALDGDADRLLIVTPEGKKIGGDQMIAMLAKDWNERGLLRGGVVSTNMSNVGLVGFLKRLGIPYFESAVGDKNVIAMMHSRRSNLGGEESGHVILSDYATTGDGIVAALQILAILVSKGARADELFPVFEEVPVVGRSIRVHARSAEAGVEQGLDDQQASCGLECSKERIRQAISAGEAIIMSESAADASCGHSSKSPECEAWKNQMGGVNLCVRSQEGSTGVSIDDDGLPMWKIIVRRSGTEPVIRVLVQHSNRAVIEKVVQSIVNKLQNAEQ